MFRFPNIATITPEQFERTVQRWFESFAETVDSFQSQHRESVTGVDGDFEFDVTVRFSAFGGAKFFVICECKKHKNPIKREMIQALRDRKESVGAHKAFLVATSSFQDGAEKYAAVHGIALIQIVSGIARYIQNSLNDRPVTIPEDADTFVGLYFGDTSGGLMYPTLVDTSHTYDIERLLTHNDRHN